MKQFAVAIIGCGNVSRMHFEAYLRHPERIRIAAVCDSIPESIDEVRRVYGIEQGFPTPVRESFYNRRRDKSYMR